jgi:hypothetical protein
MSADGSWTVAEDFPMNLAPVFLRELRSIDHLRRLRRERATVAGVAGVALVALLFADRFDGITMRRAMRTLPLAGIAPSLLFVVGLSRASTLFSTERREGTLPLLLLTHLSGFDIVFGKLLQALVTEASAFLAIVPILVLPMLASGLDSAELGFALLASVNVLFYALVVGIFASVWADGQKATAVCLVLFLPVMLYSSPVVFLLPLGGIRTGLSALQWISPLEPLAHVQMVAGGWGRGSFWWSLLVSHAVAWGWLGLAGLALPRACRWHQGRDLSHQRRRWRKDRTKSQDHSLARRARLLNSNPYFWLCYRRRWPTLKIWLILILGGLAWGTLAVLVWSRPGVNVTYLMAAAAGATWAVALLAGLPAEASYQIVEDRHSGALELLLCTPMDERRIVQGQWMNLRRRYLGPFLFVICLAAILVTVGYLTAGFGGMLDPDELRVWLFAWISGMVLLPIALASLCYVAMRRALFAVNAGEASALAFLHVIGFPVFALWGLGALLPLGFPGCAVLLGIFGLSLVARACRARTIVLTELRQAAAEGYSPGAADRGSHQPWKRCGIHSPSRQ